MINARPTCGRSHVEGDSGIGVLTLSVANWRGKPATYGSDISRFVLCTCGETSVFVGLTRKAVDGLRAALFCCAPPQAAARMPPAGRKWFGSEPYPGLKPGATIIRPLRGLESRQGRQFIVRTRKCRVGAQEIERSPGGTAQRKIPTLSRQTRARKGWCNRRFSAFGFAAGLG